MFKNLTRLYAGVVMLLCTIILVITTSLGVSNLLMYKLPEEMQSANFEKFSSVESYKNSFYDEQKAAIQKLSEDDLMKRMEKGKQEEINRQKRNAISSMLHSASWFFVSLLFLLVHAIIYRRAKAD